MGSPHKGFLLGGNGGLGDDLTATDGLTAMEGSMATAMVMNSMAMEGLTATAMAMEGSTATATAMAIE